MKSFIKYLAIGVLGLSLFVAKPVEAQLFGPTRRIQTSLIAPATCSVGDIYFQTSAPVGPYICTAANTWSSVPASGTGSSSTLWVGPLATSFDSSIQAEAYAFNGTGVFTRADNTVAPALNATAQSNATNANAFNAISNITGSVASATATSLYVEANYNSSGVGGQLRGISAYLANNSATGTVADARAFSIDSAYTAGGPITSFTGLFVADQTVAATNYAIRTGLGTVAFGDKLQLVPQAMTAGTMTVTNAAEARQVTSRFDWTNAMVTALGASPTGDITICTLPAKTIVKNVYIVIDTPDTSANALTISVGRVSATYLDYIGNSDAKAAANTVYGDAAAERGTNLTGYDLPAVAATTLVKAHLIKTTTNLNTVTGSTGHIYITTEIVP